MVRKALFFRVKCWYVYYVAGHFLDRDPTGGGGYRKIARFLTKKNPINKSRDCIKIYICTEESNSRKLREYVQTKINLF